MSEHALKNVDLHPLKCKNSACADAPFCTMVYLTRTGRGPAREYLYISSPEPHRLKSELCKRACIGGTGVVDRGRQRLKKPSTKYGGQRKSPQVTDWDEASEIPHFTRIQVGLSRKCRDWATGRGKRAN